MPSSSKRNPFRSFFGALSRKKPLDGRTETDLNRCLNLLELTTLGVGSTLGLGLYVLAGQVASNKAGPAVVVSFAIASLASAFSALCYAEFAGRVPRAGSAYAYSYITVGEFVAFIIGWNLMLEYVIGAASVARGFSGYLRFVFERVSEQLRHCYDSTTKVTTITEQIHPMPPSSQSINGTLANSTTLFQTVTNKQFGLALMSTTAELTNTAPTATTNWESIIDYLWKYFDWISIAIIVVITGFILFGVKESTNLTLVFTVVNLTVVLVVVISSLGSLDLHNWQLKKEELPSASSGEGGFMPHGWAGVLAGSATCFFGFIGFDTIASSAEEAKNPKRNVPLSILLSLFISFVAYMAVAVVQTLLWPYYAQDSITILPYIFAQLDMPVTYWIVLVGAIAGLASSQLGAIYPLPRILYSMAQDKLIYGSLAHVNEKLKLPVRATIVGSVFISLLACLLDIQDLADMVSIGTLAAYSLVSISVLIIRYEDRSDAVDDSTQLSGRLSFQDLVQAESETMAKTSIQLSLFDKEQWNSTIEYASTAGETMKAAKKLNKKDLVGSWQNGSADRKSTRLARPTDATSKRSKSYILTIVVLTILLSLVSIGLTSWTNREFKSDLVSSENDNMVSLKRFLACSAIVLMIGLIVVVFLLSRLPTGIEENQKDMFMVPLVPITPTLSILVNTFLMLNLSYLTWVRFVVWMAIGFFIYFSYGIWHSEGYFIRLRTNSATVANEKESRQPQV